MPQSSTVFKAAGLVCLLVLISGCATVDRMQINDAIRHHQEASSKVTLGDPKEKVLAILEPTQSDLKSEYKKIPERYRLDDGSVVEIYYFRSARYPDGVSTDDEFIPYIFKDGHLVGVGWTWLGGPVTRARADAERHIEQQAIIRAQQQRIERQLRTDEFQRNWQHMQQMNEIRRQNR